LKKRSLVFIIGIVVFALLAVYGCGASPPNEGVNEEIARNYLLDSPTFKFDGIADSLELNATYALALPYNWIFVYDFECAHTGYGDRSGQYLEQVVTPHTARITVLEGEVTSATIDTIWAMVNQSLVPGGG